MTHTITATYSSLVTLGSASDNPTTIAATGQLNGGLSLSYQGLTVVNAGSIAGDPTTGNGVFLSAAGSVTNQSGGAIPPGGHRVQSQ